MRSTGVLLVGILGKPERTELNGSVVPLRRPGLTAGRLRVRETPRTPVVLPKRGNANPSTSPGGGAARGGCIASPPGELATNPDESRRIPTVQANPVRNRPGLAGGKTSTPLPVAVVRTVGRDGEEWHEMAPPETPQPDRPAIQGAFSRSDGSGSSPGSNAHRPAWWPSCCPRCRGAAVARLTPSGAAVVACTAPGCWWVGRTPEPR